MVTNNFLLSGTRRLALSNKIIARDALEENRVDTLLGKYCAMELILSNFYRY